MKRFCEDRYYKMSNFRVTVNLSNFFHDHRSRARIFINDDIQTISDLENRVEEIFGINNFHLTSQNEYLPPLEDVRILQKDDIIWTIPNIEGTNLRGTPKISSENSLQSTNTDSKKRSISLIDDYGEEEINHTKKKKKKKHNPEKVTEDVPPNEKIKKKRKHIKADVTPPEVVLDVAMEAKNIAPKSKERKKKDDSPKGENGTNTDNNVIKMNTLLPVLHSHISTYNKKINSNLNKTNATLNPCSEVPSSTATKENDSNNDSDEMQDCKKEKYKCKGNLAAYKKKVSLPTITDQYLQQRKVNIVKIECISGATKLKELQDNNRSDRSVNKINFISKINFFDNNRTTQNCVPEKIQNNSFDQSYKSDIIGTCLSPSTSVHDERPVSYVGEKSKKVHSEPPIQIVEPTSGIEHLLPSHRTINIADVTSIRRLSKVNELCTQNNTNSPKDAFDKRFLSNVDTCSPLTEKGNNTVLNTNNEQELTGIDEKEVVVNNGPNTSNTVTTQKEFSKEPVLPYQQKYFTVKGEPSDHKRPESLCDLVGDLFKSGVNKGPKFVLQNHENKKKSSSDDTNQDQLVGTYLQEENSQIMYTKPQESITKYENKIYETLPYNTNTLSENSQIDELSSIRYLEPSSRQVTTNSKSTIDESLLNGTIQSSTPDLKLVSNEIVKSSIIYMKKLHAASQMHEAIDKPLLADINYSQASKTKIAETNLQTYETSMEINQSLDTEISAPSYVDTADNGFIEASTDTNLHKNEVNLNDSLKSISYHATLLHDNLSAVAADKGADQYAQDCMETSETPSLSNSGSRYSIFSEIDLTKDMSELSSGTPSGHLRKKQSGIDSPEAEGGKFITKRQRKRVRKRRKKNNTSINNDSLLNDSSLIITEAYLPPKPMKVKACPSMHIKFEEENGDNVKVIDLVKPADNNESFPEMSMGHITINSDLEDSKIKCTIGEQDILKSPSMCKMLPKKGDFIAFKVLRITDSYTPEISSYITGQVLKFHGDTKQVMFEILNRLDQCEEPKGKLSVDAFANNKKSARNTKRTFAWGELIDPRLLFP